MSTPPIRPDYDNWKALHVITKRLMPHDLIPALGIIASVAALYAPASDVVKGIAIAGVITVVVLATLNHNAKTTEKSRDDTPDPGG